MVKMIKFKFNCSNTVTVILFICYIHHSVIASSFQNPPLNHNVLASTFTNKVSPKRRSFFETFKNSYTSIIPNKLRDISIMNMLTGKRKNKKPAEDEELIYSDIINNPAIFTSMYSEKLAPQFQSIFSELDESYAKNPPPNLGSQLALKANGLSFQPILDLTPNGQPNNLLSNHQMTNNNNQINNQMNLPANNLHNNQLNSNKPTNQIDSVASGGLVDNKLSNLLGQQSARNQFSILFTGTQLNQPLQPNKLSDSSLTAAASSSPYTKHFSSNTLTSLGSSISNSLTSNLLNLKNKFSQQKNANYFKNYKSYKDLMINNPLNINQQLNNQHHQLNNVATGGAMLASANQYNYFQQRPNQPLPVFQQQQSFNRYQMLQSASTRKKCKNVQCPSASRKRVVQQQFNNNNNNFNNNNYNNKMQDYESNLISNNVRQKQFYSMQQEQQRPTNNLNTYSTKTASSSGGFSQQKQNNFYKPVSDEKAGNQIKVGSDIITYDDIEQALRRNNLHKVTNKDAQVYAQLHNLLMNTVQTNNGQFNNYQVDSKVNVEDSRSPRMFANKGKIFDDTYQQQQQQQGTKGWKPKITQQPQQQEFNQVKDTDLDQKLLFDEPQIKETDQQQKLTDEDDFSQITQQKEPVQQQVTTNQWQPVSKPTTKSPGGVKTKSKSKSGTKTPSRKSPVKGVKSPTKLAKLQLASDSNSTDTNKASDNSTTNVIETSITTTASSLIDDLNNREVEDTSGKLANSTTTLITQSGPNGSMKIIKKIKRRKKKRITSDKSNDLQAVRKNPSKGQAAKLIANSFEDQVKTDVSSEVESTTNSGQLIDTTTLNANTEVQFDDTTAVSDEQLDQKSKVTSTTVTLNTIPNKQEQVKGRMLAKKKKVMESIATTTQSSDSLTDSSPDNSRDDSLETSLDEDKKNNDQDTYFNENVTESNDNLDGDNLRSSRLKVKNSVRKKKLKSSNLTKNKPAHTSINSSIGDFTATFSTDDEEPFRRIQKNKARTLNRQMHADESLENMHFRIDDMDADDYDNLNNKDNENDGFSNGFSNEFDNSETRNQLNKLSLSGQPAADDTSNKQINQTLFNSLLKNNKLMSNTSLGSVQPIPHLVMMSMNAGNDNLGDDESLDNMDVNQTIADLVQKINQANNGNLNLINEYRNYFTEEEFDLLTELLKREANKTSIHLNLTNNFNNTTTNVTKKDQVNTAESERKDLQSYYTDYDEKDALKKFNSSSPIYLDNNGQASLKEYYYNNKEDIGKDVLINILNTKSKNSISGQSNGSKIIQVY